LQKIKLYSIILITFSLILLIALLWLINKTAPAGLGNIFLFYLIFGSFVFCVSTLLGLYLRRAWGQREFLNQYFATAMRQGLWFTILLTVSLILARRNLFSWLNAGFLVLTLVFLESYLLTRKNIN
jgi:hypothetical protein